MRLYYLLIILCLGLGFSPLYATDNEASRAYAQEPLAGDKAFSADTWDKVTKGLLYKKPEPKPEPIKPPSDPSWNGPNWSWPDFDFDAEAFLRFVLIFVLIMAAVYLIFALIKGNTRFRNLKVDSEEYRLEQLEKDLPRANVRSFLEEAIHKGNYRLALRLYYLELIKQLSLAGLVAWKRDKTNGQYRRELGDYPEFQRPFADLTYTFEYVWYKEKGVQFEQADFAQVEPQFRQLIEQIIQHANRQKAQALADNSAQ